MPPNKQKTPTPAKGENGGFCACVYTQALLAATIMIANLYIRKKCRRLSLPAARHNLYDTLPFLSQVRVMSTEIVKISNLVSFASSITVPPEEVNEFCL